VSEPLFERTRERRRRFLQAVGEGAVVLAGRAQARRNGDSHYPFRQDSDLFYLTGFPEPDTVCVLFPEQERMILFVPPRDEKAEIWNGRRAGVDGARDLYGATEAFPNTELATRLPQLLETCSTLHYALGSRDDVDRLILDIVQKHRVQRPRQDQGILALSDPTQTLHDMRLVKDEYEIDCMRKAAQATTAGYHRMLRSVHAGMFEYELQAILEYEFRRHGGCPPAYSSIIGSGDNATILHYVENSCRLTRGQLVLVDAGAEYASYACDVTRTFPVDRHFSATQRHLYEVVLEAQSQAIDAIRPGASFTDGHQAAVWCLCEGLVDLGLVAGPVDRLVESGDYRRFYMHRTGHWLGLDVHDAGRYRRNQAARSLEPGMVLTVEPGLYFAADRDDIPEEFRGIGIRIEDDVLVTSEGRDVLTAAIPKAVAEIETLRASASSH